MAHHMKVTPVPHINKDGKPSASKKDYRVTDRHRGNKRVVGTATSRAAAVEIIEREWEQINKERAL